MAQKQSERKYFGNPQEGMLNADDAAFAIPINSWINAENIRSGSTDKGTTATIESIGNTNLISQPQPSINFLTIGSAVDIPNNRFCYFKYNTTGRNDKIVCYDAKANIEYDVLLSSQVIGGLNFSKESPIHSARIINGLLYWPDSTNNQPREINIDSGILANNPSYITKQPAYNFPLNFSDITIIKPTEIRGITDFTKFTDSGTPINLIYNKAFQFAWQFIYYDDSTSVISMYSAMCPINSATDTFNKISIDMDSSETIPTTVRIVNLIVRTLDGTITGGTICNVIKTWDREIASDNILINNQGVLGSFLNDIFDNSSLGIAIDPADILRPFDNVPIYSESLETAKDRLFLANNTEGYDTPTSTSIQLTTTKTSYGYPTNVVPCFVGNAAYRGGIIFMDFGMRRCGVVTNSGAVLVTDQLLLGNLGTAPNSFSVTSAINWGLSNANAVSEIPDWAYYYIPALTLNQKTRFFISAIEDGGSLRYVVRNTDGTYTYSNGAFPSNCYGIAINVSELVRNNLGYVYTEGDICVFSINFTSGSGTTITKGVIAQDGEYVIIQPQNIGTISSGFDFGYYEIYTPYISSTTEPFYDQGYVYLINNPGTSIRNYSTVSGSFNTDSYVLMRLPDPIGNLGIYGSAMSPNDFYYKRWDSSISRSNFVTNLGQFINNTEVSWSDTFIPNTAVNGLSTFRVGNAVNVPQNCGSIGKLQLTSKISDPKEGNVMLAICTNETNSMYLGETQITDSTGETQFFSSATGVISTINTLKGSSGTINPESVTAYRGQVWWGDAINGRWTQYSENGLFFISSLKMVRFWKNWFLQYNGMTTAQLEALGSVAFLSSTIDPGHDELLISLPKLSNIAPKGDLPDYPSTIYPFDILDFQEKTIVFKLEKAEMPAHWQGSYTMQPECFVGLNNKLYSFKNGLLYIHNQTNGVPNTFYGVTYPSKIMCVSNMNAIIPKVYNNIEVQANMTPFFVYLYNLIPEQQSSDLVDFDFRNYEGIFKAPIYRNKLVPSATGYTTDGLLTGQKMRNVAMFILLQFNPIDTPLELKFLEVGFQNSSGQDV